MSLSTQRNAAAAHADWDARKHPVCPPWSGHKGAPFERFYTEYQELINGCDDRADPADIYTARDTLLGQDDNGVFAALPAAGSAAERRRSRRPARLYASLYKHVSDESIRNLIKTEASQDGRAAWLVCIREGRVNVTELTLQDLKAKVRALKMLLTVGISQYSISDFKKVLIDTNLEITTAADRLDENELCLIQAERS